VDAQYAVATLLLLFAVALTAFLLWEQRKHRKLCRLCGLSAAEGCGIGCEMCAEVRLERQGYRKRR